MKPLSILIIFMLFSIAGCGDGDTTSSQSRGELSNDSDELAKVFWGSCKETEANTTAEVNCQEWYGEAYRGVNMKHTCQISQGGEFSDQKCKTEEVVGTCLRERTTDSENRFYYYQSVWSRDSAVEDCTKDSESPGEWSETDEQGSIGRDDNDRRGRRWHDRRDRRNNRSLQIQLVLSNATYPS